MLRMDDKLSMITYDYSWAGLKFGNILLIVLQFLNIVLSKLSFCCMFRTWMLKQCESDRNTFTDCICFANQIECPTRRGRAVDTLIHVEINSFDKLVC